MTGKRDEMRNAIQRRALSGIYQRCCTMNDRVAAEAIRVNAQMLSSAVAFECCNEYEFLEIADIMEWRRERIRR
jgi:hypothetical protein